VTLRSQLLVSGSWGTVQLGFDSCIAWWLREAIAPYDDLLRRFGSDMNPRSRH